MVLKRLGQVLVLLPSVILIFGSIFIFVADNLISFVFSIILPILLVLNLFFGIYWLFKKSKFLFVALIGFIVYFFCFDLFFQCNKHRYDDKEFFTLLSYNPRAFNVKKEINQENINKQIVSFVEEKSPDIVCFQEFSHLEFKNFANYSYKFIGHRKKMKKSLQVIYSKFPIINKGYVDFPNTRNNAMFVDIAYNNETIRIYNLHLESYKTNTIHQLNNPKSYSALTKRIEIAEKVRKNQAILVKKHVDSFSGKVLICGDFNATQFSSTYNLIKNSRLDSFIEAGKGFGSTYNLYNYPFRLDYILVDNSFKVISHENFELKLSDHEPIFVKLALK